MRTLIVEDEPKNIKILKRFISEYFPTIEVIGDAQDVQKAEELYRSLIPDLIFLDIQLTKGTAFDFLDKVMPISCAVIFVTAYDNYALKAFRYSAIDYLLKPINLIDLKESISKAQQKVGSERANIHLKSLLENISNPSNNKIALPIEQKFLFININEIMYCKAIGSKTIIYANQNRKYTIAKPIGEYEELLPSKIFFRIHNSYLININFIVKYIKGRGGYIEMQDGVTIEVATRRKEEFLSRFTI
jgi:two-component system LytT family response regulator